MPDRLMGGAKRADPREDNTDGRRIVLPVPVRPIVMGGAPPAPPTGPINPMMQMQPPMQPGMNPMQPPPMPTGPRKMPGGPINPLFPRGGR